MLETHIERFAPVVGVARACAAFGVNPRTRRHRRQAVEGRARPRPRRDPQPRRAHPAAISETDKDQIVATLCSDRFADMAPAQVYATLLDEGSYLCCERQMYRILAERGLVRERRRGGHQHAGAYGVPRLEATRPNRVWTWDITKLPGAAKGVRYFLYTIIDIYSRKIVGWTIAERESEKIARRLIRETCRRYGIDRNTLTIHSDRGSPMIAGTVGELLNELGVAKSHSRPASATTTRSSNRISRHSSTGPTIPAGSTPSTPRVRGAANSSTGTTRPTTTARSATCGPPTSTTATTPPSSNAAKPPSTPRTPHTPNDSHADPHQHAFRPRRGSTDQPSKPTEQTAITY